MKFMDKMNHIQRIISDYCAMDLGVLMGYKFDFDSRVVMVNFLEYIKDGDMVDYGDNQMMCIKFDVISEFINKINATLNKTGCPNYFNNEVWNECING